MTTECDIDHYAVLGVGASASHEQIRLGYHQQARCTHPDRNPGAGGAGSCARGTGTVEFQRVQLAWKVLSDPILRREYDQKRLQRHLVAESAHCLETVAVSALDCVERDNVQWRYQECRCGGEVAVSALELNECAIGDFLILPCPVCSVSIRVYNDTVCDSVSESHTHSTTESLDH